MRSRRGWTTWPLSWRTVQLWQVPARTLLAAGDIGLIPWVPLTQYDESPEAIVRECRERIDRAAPPNEHETLLAVTQFLARLRYNDPRLFNILGGRKAMIESPVLQEIIAEGRVQGRRESLVAVLTTRFGAIGDELESDLKSIEDEARLNELIKLSASCRSLKSFRKHLTP
jgi:predicted transposase YdaD